VSFFLKPSSSDCQTLLPHSGTSFFPVIQQPTGLDTAPSRLVTLTVGVSAFSTVRT
jgi:hypothetical protein